VGTLRAPFLQEEVLPGRTPLHDEVNAICHMHLVEAPLEAPHTPGPSFRFGCS
jgi:hypothetical protein